MRPDYEACVDKLLEEIEELKAEKERLRATIKEAIEVMDEEPARDWLEQALKEK